MQAWEMLFWHWWALAALLLIIELLLPMFFFLWLSAAAAVTGGIALLLPGMRSEAQVFLFSALSLLSVLAWYHYFKKYPKTSDHPLLNKRGAQYVGRVFTLDAPIVNGRGKIKVDDSIWEVEGKDCAPPDKVKVTGANGVVLVVEKVD